MSYPRFICGICKYVHESPPVAASAAKGTSAPCYEDLPEGFTCPVCASAPDTFFGCTCQMYSVYEQTAVHGEEKCGDVRKDFICTACDYIIHGFTEDGFEHLAPDWSCPSCNGPVEFYQPCSCVPYPERVQPESGKAA